jgi:predicted double-glycine peptidase
MTSKTAKANVSPVRQRTQYSCMATSMMMCLRANGVECNEDEVNKVMGARPMKGASWEDALACAQHYGMRATLTCPSTVSQLKEWTDRGVPVMIAWNPEGRDWSHASVVFDVDEDGNVYVADPNIPDPDETVRVVPKAEFYKKWSEKWPNYLVRRPACAIEREITSDGRQVMASQQGFDQTGVVREVVKYMEDYLEGSPTWITARTYTRSGTPVQSISFTYDAKDTPYTTYSGKKAQRADAAFKSLRKRLGRFGLKANPASEADYRTDDGAHVELSIGGYSGSAVSGQTLRVASTQLGSAREDYIQAVTNLEASADLVAVATNKLRSLGHEPRDEDYPFMSDIEMVASDIYRWKGELDRKYAAEDQIRVAHRVAEKYLRRKP